MFSSSRHTCSYTRSFFPDSPAYNTLSVVYIVTDIWYLTREEHIDGKGITDIDSVYSTRKAANARAKKLIHDGIAFTPHEIKEERSQGLYVGTGYSHSGGGHYARKCTVEVKAVDDESDDGEEWC